MIRAVGRLVFGMVVFLLACGTSEATVSVSPVIVEAARVQAGQFFEIACENWGEQDLDLQLSLALFDQDERGRVVFLEDVEAVRRAKEVLNLDREVLFLETQAKSIVRVELTQDDFDHLYAVLFVKPKQGGVPTRFAVLFLLSTSESQANLSVSSGVQEGEALAFTVHNKGLRHGLWEGELHLFDASDQLGERRKVTSGVVLAGRSRGVQVSLPHWVQRVEIISDHWGQSR